MIDPKELPAKNKRVKDIIDQYANGKVVKFVSMLNETEAGRNISQQQVNRIFNIEKRGRAEKYPGVSSVITDAIVSRFKDVNPAWLLTGEGEEKMKNNSGGEKSQSNMVAINNLSEGNKELCQANKRLADAHYIVAQGNAELIQMLKAATAHVPLETHEDAQARLAPVLELIARIGSGETKWNSYAEGLAEVHKYAAS